MTPTEIVVKSWLGALIWVAVAVGAGAVSGRIAFRVFGTDGAGITTWMQWAAVGLLLWATFGHAGWAIQTWDGDTPAEIWNGRIFKALHLVASYLLAFSITWPQPARLG